MFLPMTTEELNKLGWKELDIILVTADPYIDSPFIGVSVIGKYLFNVGYRVGVISQPDIASNKDISIFNEPKLFWGITAGAVDSMVSNYTSLQKKIRKDKSSEKPDRACIVYTNLIRRYFKNTKPIVLGGIEASLRRIVHYDYWDNNIRRSILFDAKADILVYGMGEKTVLELADKLKKGEDFKDIRGICYISDTYKQEYVNLPSYEEVKGNKDKFIEMFNLFYENSDPFTAKGLCQKQDSRYLVQNPPQSFTQKEIDKIYELSYERTVHPYCRKKGAKDVPIIKFSIVSHRGCFGECNFCSLSIHQGRTVVSRSEESMLREAENLTKIGDFKGNIYVLSGPTSNMYGVECKKEKIHGVCRNKKCFFPEFCKNMEISHKKQIEFLRKMRKIKGVKNVFVTSGIRYDMIIEDEKYGLEYLKEIINYHISGQMKIAPEHTEENVLNLIGKTTKESKKYLEEFVNSFYSICRKSGKKQFLTYYFIAAHPGCTVKDMEEMKKFIKEKLKINPEQVQVFTPTPSTYSTLMYWTEKDPFTGKKIFVEKSLKEKKKQKEIII